MKRFMIFIVIVVSIFSLNFFSEHSLLEIFKENISSYYLYLNNNTFNISSQNVKIFQNGEGAILKTDEQTANKIISQVNGISGECVELTNVSLTQIADKLNLEIIEKYSIESGVVINGYSNKLKSYLIDNNKKINVQIAIKSDCIIVGYPLILQGF